MTNYSGRPLAVVVADDLSDDFNYNNGKVKVRFQDTSGYALINGDADEPFKVKDADNNDEAVNKGQLEVVKDNAATGDRVVENGKVYLALGDGTKVEQRDVFVRLNGSILG